MVNKPQSPDPNKCVYVVRVWRTNSSEAWRYTVVTTNVDTKHHFATLVEAMAFIDPTSQENLSNSI